MRLVLLSWLLVAVRCLGDQSSLSSLSTGSLIVSYPYGSHQVFWTHDGWVNPGPDQVDLQYSNVMSLSYGATVQQGVYQALYPATNYAVLSDPVFDFSCNYWGTNLMLFSGAYSSINFYHYVIDGDDNSPYTEETNVGTGWIHLVFQNKLKHTLRFRINGKQYHGGIVRIMTGDKIAPTLESAHRPRIIGFGDSHSDGNTSAGEMDTYINRLHSYLATPCDLFGSGIGGSGIIPGGVAGIPYTNRFYNDVFVQQSRPDMLIYEGSNDHAYVVDAGTSNQFALGISYICSVIATNLPAGNVWMVYGPQPSSTGNIDTGSIFCRNTLQSNCDFYGYHFIDFLGGATNTADVNRGFVTDVNYATLWAGGHLSAAGKDLFAQILATNLNNTAVAIARRR